MNLQSIVDQRAAGDDDVRVDEVEVQPGRRQPLEVGGIGEERKDFFARTRQPDVTVDPHLDEDSLLFERRQSTNSKERRRKFLV